MSPPRHDAVSALRRALADWRVWAQRAVVLAHAAVAGLAVVAFTWLGARAFDTFLAAQARWPWLPLVWTPLVCAALVAFTRRFVPGATGSGIPQVMAALACDGEPQRRGVFVSLRIALARIVVTAVGLLAGLVLGREGPAVQIGASVMHNAARWLPAGSAITPHALVVAGGAAGVAAAFNAPLAGVLFAIEQLTRQVEERSSGLVIAAIVLAGLVGVAVFGNASTFGVIQPPPLALGMLWPGLLVVLACGLLGGLFSRLLIVSVLGDGRRLSRWRERRPVLFAAACGLAIAVIGAASGGSSWGAGYESTQALLEGGSQRPGVDVGLRLAATWLSVWSGVPGGVFAPSVALGAGIGHDVAFAAGWREGAAVFIALGMVAFLAAVTQAPITAFIVVMEMVSGHAMVLSLMAAALVAHGIARAVSPPMYATLAQAALARLAPAPGAAPAPPG